MSLRAWYFHRSASLIVRSRTAEKIVDGALEEVDGRSFEELSQERDTLTMGLLEYWNCSRIAVRSNLWQRAERPGISPSRCPILRLEEEKVDLVHRLKLSFNAASFSVRSLSIAWWAIFDTLS